MSLAHFHGACLGIQAQKPNSLHCIACTAWFGCPTAAASHRVLARRMHVSMGAFVSHPDLSRLMSSPCTVGRALLAEAPSRSSRGSADSESRRDR
jgi:hypothetical protein